MELKPLKSLSERVFETAYQEVLGDDCYARTGTGTAPGLVDLCECLGRNYNPNCACGLAQQIGRSAFTQLARTMNGLDRLTDQSFRLLPAKQRLTRGMAVLKQLLEELFGISVRVIDDQDTIRLETTGHQGRHVLIPHLETGFIEEYILWMCGGKPHPISVHPDTPGWFIQIGKQPLES
jgi:hypothetical protein